MAILKLVSFAVLMALIIPVQSEDLFRQCVFSEIASVNSIIFKFKTLETSSVFSLLINEIPHKETFALVDSVRGSIRLVKSLFGILTWRSDNTARISTVLTQRKDGLIINRITIEFIILKEGWADGLLSDVISSVPTLAKLSNVYRPVSNTYPWSKKFHSILMKSTRRSSITSLAECKFHAAYLLLAKSILRKLQVNLVLAIIHVGPQGILTPEKLQELIEATGCIPEIEISQCGPETSIYRTIDGTCNNLREPTNGAAETGFTRFLPPLYFDAEGLDEPAGGGLDQPDAPDLPNPSVVTEDYIVIQAKNQPNRDFINHIFMQWGQFLDHDMTLAPESENGDVCEDIPCVGSEEDFQPPCFPVLPARDRPCIRLIRSAARCPIDGFKLLPREQINVNTAYLDASMVYGSSEGVANAVRDTTNDFGLLLTSGNNLLPLDNTVLGEPNDLCLNVGGCFLAGDVRVNEQAALAAMHTLWVREHNQIAKNLRAVNLHWDGERIFQETRKIVGALVQQITYEEWLPIAIGRDALRRYRGYRRNVNAGISNAFATAGYRLGHSLIRPKFEFLKKDFTPFSNSPIPLINIFFNNTEAQVNGIDGWLIGMVANSSQEMDNEMALGLTDQLFQRDVINRVGLNLAALNIQRGREHGLPFYASFLAECGKRFPGLYPIDVSNVQTFDEIRQLFPPTVFESIKSVYKNDPRSTDLWPAGIGETPTDPSFGRPRRWFYDDAVLPDPILGPTFTCLLIDQFERLRDGDRFFYERRGQFSYAQMWAIRGRQLSDVLCSNIDIVSVPRLAFLGPPNYSCGNTGPLNVAAWREPVRSCSQRPCRNNGVCRQFRRRRRNIVRCRCHRGFNGRFCQNKTLVV